MNTFVILFFLLLTTFTSVFGQTSDNIYYYPHAHVEITFQALNGTVLKTVKSPAAVVYDFNSSRAYFNLGPFGKRWTFQNETYLILPSSNQTCYLQSNSTFDDLIQQHSQVGKVHSTETVDIYSGLVEDFYSGDQRLSLSLVTDKNGAPIQRMSTQLNPYKAFYVQGDKTCSGSTTIITLKLDFGKHSDDPLACECLFKLPTECLISSPPQWLRVFCFN